MHYDCRSAFREKQLPDELDKLVTLLQTWEWLSARLARFCAATQAEMTSLDDVASDAVYGHARKLIAQLRQMLDELQHELDANFP